MTPEAITWLSQYIRINTSNPPGNEAAAAEFLAGILDSEGIASEKFETAPGRTSLLAVLPGSGLRPPLILLNHMDVVPAEADLWTFDPFGGEVGEGFIHGRGALDMKSQGIMELIAFLTAKREGWALDRDLVFLAVADEEMGGGLGAEWILERMAGRWAGATVLNEGGFGLTGLLPDRPAMMVSTAEKGICWLKLVSRGPSGHGSLPQKENALERMTTALARLLEHEFPVNITPVTADYFTALGQGWDFLAPYLEDGRTETLAEILDRTGLSQMPQISAMLRNTVSLNVLHSGEKTNVIPPRAEARLDARLLPGRDPEAFIRELAGLLGDPEISIEPLTVSAATESPRDTDEYRTISQSPVRCFSRRGHRPDPGFRQFGFPFFQKTRDGRVRGLPGPGHPEGPGHGARPG